MVVPLASAIVARRQDYFDALGAYREGDAGPITEAFARGSTIAAEESTVTARRLAAMPADLAFAGGNARARSAARRILDDLLDHPVFSADEVESIGGATFKRLPRAGTPHCCRCYPATDQQNAESDLGGRIVDGRVG